MNKRIEAQCIRHFGIKPDGMVDEFFSPRAKKLWEQRKADYALGFEEGVEFLLEQQAREEDYIDDLEQQNQLANGLG